MKCDIGEAMEGLENELQYDVGKRRKGWTMRCDVDEVTERFRHFTYVTTYCPPFRRLPTSQLILQPFHCFTYVTVHSPTLLSPLLRHRIFTCFTWRAAHVSHLFYVLVL